MLFVRSILYVAMKGLSATCHSWVLAACLINYMPIVGENTIILFRNISCTDLRILNFRCKGL